MSPSSRCLGSDRGHLEDTWRGVPRSVLVAAALVGLIAIPLVWVSLRFVEEARLDRLVRAAVTTQAAEILDAEIVDLTINSQNGSLDLLVIVRTQRQPGYEQVVALQSAVADTSSSDRWRCVWKWSRRPDLILLIPPTFTPTPTLTATPTLGPSPTPTHTATPTATTTATRPPRPPRPFQLRRRHRRPVQPRSWPEFPDSSGMGVVVREAPGGAILFTLAGGRPDRSAAGRLHLRRKRVASDPRSFRTGRLGGGTICCGWPLSPLLPQIVSSAPRRVVIEP